MFLESNPLSAITVEFSKDENLLAFSKKPMNLDISAFSVVNVSSYIGNPDFVSQIIKLL